MERPHEFYYKTTNSKTCSRKKTIFSCLGGLVLIFFIIFMIVYSVLQADEVNKTLMHVHVIFRHGEKYPGSVPCYSSNPYKNVDYFPYGRGSLTANGRKMSYRMGEIYRSRYLSFLGSSFYPTIVDAISTSYARCEMTLLLALAGLFPPTNEFKIKRELAWQPIPYKIFQTTKVEELACNNQSPKEVTYNESTINLFRYISENTGCNITDLKVVYYLADLYKEYQALGFELPEWSRNIWPDKLLRSETDFFMENINYNRTPTITGALISLLYKNMQSAIKTESRKDRTKIFLYAVNKVHVVSLLSFFQQYYGQDITYISQIVMEVHKINGTRGLKLFLKNGQFDEFEPLRFEKYPDFYPLTDFYDFAKNIISLCE